MVLVFVFIVFLLVVGSVVLSYIYVKRNNFVVDGYDFVIYFLVGEVIKGFVDYELNWNG